jgi:hypothetical protein
VASHVPFLATAQEMPLKNSTQEVFRYAYFDSLALCRLASQLRDGQASFCDLFQVPANGSLNWAILLSFEDGVEWVFRAPRSDGAIRCEEVNATLLASEAATLRYIRANSAIPVPEVFAYRYGILCSVACSC